MDFDVDTLDRRRARQEARSRLFASAQRLTVGRYELGARLGSGAWGVVYRAHDPLAGRDVAVKVIHEHVGEVGDLARWRREAQMLAKLDHPHVIRVFDVGIDAGRAYLVTQLVPDGRTLTQWLSTSRIDLPTLLTSFSQLADALHEVHAHGVLHRDVKPDNILVDERGSFLLADFGLAVGAHEVRTSSGFEGTPAFLPPEVRAGATADQRADVYSLCASLWFAVCRRLAPKGDPPRRLRRLFRVGLSPSPAARFADTASFARAIESAAQPRVPWRRLAVPLTVGAIAAVAVISPAVDSPRADGLDGPVPHLEHGEIGNGETAPRGTERPTATLVLAPTPPNRDRRRHVPPPAPPGQWGASDARLLDPAALCPLLPPATEPPP